MVGTECERALRRQLLFDNIAIDRAHHPSAANVRHHAECDRRDHLVAQASPSAAREREEIVRLGQHDRAAGARLQESAWIEFSWLLPKLIAHVQVIRVEHDHRALNGVVKNAHD